ncbi:MAG: putative signal transducing protein [Solirubrobacteraceae bacterium]
MKAVGARNQTEAEFIQALLLEEGIPSMLRRARGFDVPDFLAAGPRDVLVPQAGAAAAREVLLQSELLDRAGAEQTRALDWRLLLAVLGAFALVALVIELLRLLLV